MSSEDKKTPGTKPIPGVFFHLVYLHIMGAILQHQK